MDKIYEKAFTLIELLAIVVVMSVLTAIFFVDYGKDNKVFALERAARTVSQDLRRTQEMSMSGLTGEAGTNGYGIFFDKNNSLNYIIYMNKNANKYYEVGTDSIKETIKIEAGIKICDVKDNGTSTAGTISTSFFPPDPINYIENNNTGHEASIVLCVVTDTSQTRTVKMNNTGKIEITNP